MPHTGSLTMCFSVFAESLSCLVLREPRTRTDRKRRNSQISNNADNARIKKENIDFPDFNRLFNGSLELIQLLLQVSFLREGRIRSQ